MKKNYIKIIGIFLIFLVSLAVLYNNKNDDKDKNLKKVKVADATLTSRTYIIKSNDKR